MTIRVEKQEKSFKSEELFSYDLTFFQVKILKLLITYRTHYRWVYPSQQFIARSVGCKPKTVQRSINRLKALGLHSWINRAPSKNNRQSNLYILDDLLDPAIYKKLMNFFTTFFKISLFLLASKRPLDDNVLLINKGYKESIYTVVSKRGMGDYKLTRIKNMYEEYDDNPTFQDKKLTLREKFLQEQESYKGEMSKPFVPEPPKSAEYMAKQREGFADIVTEHANRMTAKEKEFALILLEGFTSNI